MDENRFARAHTTLLIVISFFVGTVVVEGQLPAVPELRASTSTNRLAIIEKGFRFDWTGFTSNKLFSRVEMPRRLRVTRSRQSLRQVMLVGGDHFVAESLEWKSDYATFRLLTGQEIKVPVLAVARLANPPGEVDLIDNSIQVQTFSQSDTLNTKSPDPNRVPEASRSLKIKSQSPIYQRDFEPPLESARIEFSFQALGGEPSDDCGEWQLVWGDSEAKHPPIIVRMGSDRRLFVVDAPQGIELSSQILTLSDDWHSFVAIVTPERTRLIVDEAILASFSTPRSSLRSIQIRPSLEGSRNSLRIDGPQVRGLIELDDHHSTTDESIESDSINLVTGDVWFGRLASISNTDVSLVAFERQQSIPWHRLTSMAWRQPKQEIPQRELTVTGLVSTIEMQPFVDRPDCEPERWSVTVVSVNSNQIVGYHPLVGELTFRWSDIRRLDPLFFGQMRLLDARRFHLGNSIRTDLHRHRPDGTDIRCEFRLPSIPAGHAFLSLDVAELEASGPTAPLGSPYLAELRAGRLITDVFVNDQRVGDLNSLIRFKSNSQHPERVRMAVPRSLLKTGGNSIRLDQKPLKEEGHEYDDCEVGPLRLEFDMTD